MQYLYDTQLNHLDPNSAHKKIFNYLKKGSSILECGCATGQMTKYIKDHLDARVYIVEQNKDAFDIAMKYADDGCCADLVGDDWVSYYKGKQFDFILFEDVLEHIYSPQETLAKAKNLLKEDGMVLISVPNVTHNDIILNMMCNKWNYTDEGLLDKTHVRFFGSDNLDGLLESANLAILEMDYSEAITNTTEQKLTYEFLSPVLCDTLKQRECGEIYQFVIAAVHKEYAEKNNLHKKSRLPKKYNYMAQLYYAENQGEFSEANSIKMRYNRGDFIQQRFNMDSMAKAFRFDPIVDGACILEDLRILSDIGAIGISDCNGILVGNRYIFSLKDPHIYFQSLTEIPAWIEIQARIIPIEDSVIASSLIDIQSKYLGAQQELAQLNEHSLQQATIIDDRARNTESILQENQKLLQHYNNAIDKLIEENACKNQVLSLNGKISTLNDTIHSKNDELISKSETINSMSNTIHSYESRVHSIMLKMDDINAENVTLKTQLQSSYKTIEDFQCMLENKQQQLQEAMLLYKSIQNSKIWKLSKPLRVGIDILKGRRRSPIHQAQIPESSDGVPNKNIPIKELYRISGHPFEPVRSTYIEKSEKRLNLVTDTITPQLLLGGVATALIIATEFCNRYGYSLRIITRYHASNGVDYENMMKLMRLKPVENLSFYSDHERFHRNDYEPLEISPDDVFFATSWWSAAACKKMSVQAKIFYVLQEVETFFYPHGDEHYYCAQILEDPQIQYIVNSSYLWDYFKKQYPVVNKQGVYFEPAFSESIFKAGSFENKTKYKMFFYARPNNPRNMFKYGLHMLDEAIRRGILDTDEWDIHMAGQPTNKIVFCNGYTAIDEGTMSWQAYAAFLRNTDLTLSLMYTPHPSYPPLDAACSGCVVLTNNYANKTDFPQCKNIISSDLNEEAFMKSFEQAIAMAKDTKERKNNYNKSSIPRDWHTAIQPVITYMNDQISEKKVKLNGGK